MHRYAAAVLLALITSGCGHDEAPEDWVDSPYIEHVVTPCAPAWAAAQVYTGGMAASVGTTNYKANWWTQGDNPTTRSGGAGSGQPWTSIGACAGATGTTVTTPAAPVSTPAPAAPVTQNPPSAITSFAYTAYKDVTISANWNTYAIATAVTGSQQNLLTLTSAPAVTWAFATGECGSETWGGIGGAALASANVQAWASAKKTYIVSTGGAAGSFTCGTDTGFAAFMDRYMSPYMVGVDFDIEAGQTQAQIAALVARVKAAQSQTKYKNLRFSFTIATLGGAAQPSLGSAGVTVMKAIKDAGLTNYYINLMAMDYGSANPANCVVASNGNCAMGLSAVQAASNLHQLYNVPYSQIELTPMIGGNDTQSEVFTLDDVAVVAAFAKRVGLGGLHFWSLDRDRDCPPGYASPICNSYGQSGVLGFSQRFATQMGG